MGLTRLSLGRSCLSRLHTTSFRAASVCSSTLSQKRCFSYQPCLQTDQRTYLNSAKRGAYKEAPGLEQFLQISEEVADALATNKPVVALESTIYTHGALGSDLPELLDSAVREHGAVPATIGVLDGVPKVGLSPHEINRMAQEGAKKLSRRDLAYLVGMGLAGRKMHGGTTIAGTMLLARLAGIRVFGTGGLGGVHRGGHDSMDISADLTELGRTRVAVISSGCKGFLDIPRTLEFLETQGVLVATFADGRSGDIDVPAFWARDSGIKSSFVVEDEKQAAAMILAQERLNIESGLLFANPIAEEFAIPREQMDAVINTAVREAEEQGFTGNANTPFILRRIYELTNGGSAPANLHLVKGNVARAARVAVELCKLESGPASVLHHPYTPVFSNSERGHGPPQPTRDTTTRADILVAGSVALDLSCDFANVELTGATKSVSPALHTSNPAAISQSIGGVGHNVALAAHRISGNSKVKLCSMIGNDIAGATILFAMNSSGLDTSLIHRLGSDYPLARTAQYVAVNDGEKNLMIAMADMSILTNHRFPTHWSATVAAAKPKWLVVDANWSSKDIQMWVKAGRQNKAHVAFEPVSTAKAAGLFPKEQDSLGIFPHASVDLATPNQYELAAMWSTAKENGYLESMSWFKVVDAFSMMGARDRFVRLSSVEMTDAGIPVQSVQLLPYIPTIITKVGAQGALLTTILKPDDPRLYDYEHEKYILTRSSGDHPHIGGIYMRLFPAAEKVEDVVSVNGVGDTFLGTMVAGLAQGGKVEDLMDVAQKAAVLTLRSRESVSRDLGMLQKRLTAAARCSEA